ncbi:hypothetical protein VH1709_contig00142-0001 [Vibrio harveyi]|nr:hypothetical protein VH1709_contig00142-0001 [Vibrio harveyi]
MQFVGGIGVVERRLSGIKTVKVVAQLVHQHVLFDGVGGAGADGKKLVVATLERLHDLGFVAIGFFTE